MTIACPFCNTDTPLHYPGTVRCASCGRMFHAERKGQGYVALAIRNELLPRYIGYEMGSPYGDPPTRSTEASAGYDLSVLRGGWIWPGRCSVFDTGVLLHMAADQHVDLRPRSGWFRRGLLVHTGLIDADYHQRVMVLARNITWRPVRVRDGDRLAQLVLPEGTLLVEHGQATLTMAPIVGRERIGGLGSTGR